MPGHSSCTHNSAAASVNLGGRQSPRRLPGGHILDRIVHQIEEHLLKSRSANPPRTKTGGHFILKADRRSPARRPQILDDPVRDRPQDGRLEVQDNLAPIRAAKWSADPQSEGQTVGMFVDGLEKPRGATAGSSLRRRSAFPRIP